MKWFLADKIAELVVKLETKHIQGPKTVKLRKNQVALVLVGRNNAPFLAENIKYHQKLGVNHVVYIDNESDDNSIEIVAKVESATIYKCSSNFRTHQKQMQKLCILYNYQNC